MFFEGKYLLSNAVQRIEEGTTLANGVACSKQSLINRSRSRDRGLKTLAPYTNV